VSASDEILLARVRWQLFVTLTFRHEEPAGRIFYVAIVWARKVERRYHLPRESLMFVVRVERGEHLGRLHAHLLVAGLPFWVPINTGERYVLQSLHCGGIARVRRETGVKGRSYLTGAELYEHKKFLHVGALYYSPGLNKYLRNQLVAA